MNPTTLAPHSNQPGATEETPLIRAAQRGSLESYNTLVLRYQNQVFQVACQILQSEPAAEDAAQAAFLRAFQKLDSFRGGSFRSWLLKITSRLCLDELRRSRRHPLLSLDGPDDLDEEQEPYLEHMAADLPGPEQTVMQREMQETVWRGLQSLPVEYRLAVELVDLQGLNYAQAAHVLGCPEGTVKSRLSRARVQLRGRLAKYR